MSGAMNGNTPAAPAPEGVPMKSVKFKMAAGWVLLEDSCYLRRDAIVGVVAQISPSPLDPRTMMKIPGRCLILTTSGQPYHLDVAPETFMKWLKDNPA